MKKLITLLFAVGISFQFSNAQATLLKGSLDFFNEAKPVYVEFDYSKMTIDALSSEDAYIEYKTKGKDAEKDKDKWLEGWKKDKKNFADNYVELLKRNFKKYPVSFNNDNPASDYKLVVTVLHIETGNPVKYSAVKLKLTVTDKSNKEICSVNIANATGAQMGAMTPTVGIRVGYAFMNSSGMLAKLVKKSVKKK